MFKLLKRLEGKHYKIIFICFIFIVFQVWLDLKLPDFMSQITILIETEGSKMSDILLQGTYMLLCALGSLISSFIVGYFAAKVAASFSQKIRSEVFNKVEDFSMTEIKKFSTSSLITRTTNDITQVQMLLALGLQVFIKAPIMAIWAIIKISGKSFEWTLLTGGAVLVLLIVVVIIVVFAVPKFKKIQNMIDDINNITRENLTGIRVVRAFNAESYQENKFEQANLKLTKTQLFVQRIMSVMGPTMQLILSGLSLGIYFVGAFIIDAANMMDRINIFSDMVVFSSYAVQVIIAFMMLIVIFIIYPRASVSAKRILEVLEEEETIKDGNIDKKTTKLTGCVEFKNVSFKYPDAEEYMLENISFKAEKGETIAFIGSTGSGKSTLINLIPRFYDATRGEVLVDGINVKDYKQETLHNLLGYIPQKAVMFDGTISSNVSYGYNGKAKATKKQIKKAIEVAQATDFVEKMDDKYESHIARGGTNVSGGQKQRLAIARAIARDPEIYIFDDSFSALDYKTDYILRKELKNYTKDATTLIVAQRIGTIKNADKIIVLDNGKMVGMGTHKELLDSCEVYKEIAYSQLSKEELDNA